MSRTRRSLLFLLLVVVPASAIVIDPPSVSAAPPLKADFNGDGFDDLAIAAILEDLGPPNVGVVHVVYGTASGLSVGGGQLWNQNAALDEAAEPYDYFGSALAVGDFNGDGLADLAVGVPDEDLPASLTDAGVVHVIYGSANGLTSTGNEYIDENKLQGQSVAGDHFGTALAAGDFDKDGFADLAIGVTGEDVHGQADAGTVYVLRGSSLGLLASPAQEWNQDSAGILDLPEAEDYFGGDLAAGDFDGNGFADLAIGVWGEDLNGLQDTGAANVLYGSVAGLSAASNQFWSQATLPGVLNTGDSFGWALTAGDFNGDAIDDLAVGVPYDDDVNGGSISNAGVVTLVYGSPQGLTQTGSQVWHQDVPAVLDLAEQGDQFGHSLTAADFNGDGADDLAVGIWAEDYSGLTNPGAVAVLYGKPGTGLSSTGNQIWSQAGSVQGAPGNHEYFGHSLAALRLNADALADLAIGVLGDTIGGQTAAGAVNVLYASTGGSGLTASGNQIWYQNVTGLEIAEPIDWFGSSLGR